MSASDPSAWLASIREVLDGLELRWAVAGAVAALVYRREPRMTVDLDVLAEWSDELPRALEAHGWVVEVLRDPGEDPHLLRARRGEQRLDVLLPVVEYQRIALDRSVDGVLAVEDVIVHKLLAWRPRDRDDIRSILAAGHAVDDGYVERWARAWEVLDRWEQARAWR